MGGAASPASSRQGHRLACFWLPCAPVCGVHRLKAGKPQALYGNILDFSGPQRGGLPNATSPSRVPLTGEQQPLLRDGQFFIRICNSSCTKVKVLKGRLSPSVQCPSHSGERTDPWAFIGDLGPGGGQVRTTGRWVGGAPGAEDPRHCRRRVQPGVFGLNPGPRHQ